MDVREIRSMEETFPDTGTTVWVNKADVVEWLRSREDTDRGAGPTALSRAAKVLEDCE